MFDRPIGGAIALATLELSASPPGYATVRSDANQSQISGGDADVDHTQIIGGRYSQIIGGIYPPSPSGFGTPAYNDTYRIFHNLPRFVSARESQVSFGITTFEALQRKYIFSFVSRLLQSENCLIANLMNSDAFYDSEYFKSFKERLYAKY